VARAKYMREMGRRAPPGKAMSTVREQRKQRRCLMAGILCEKLHATGHKVANGYMAPGRADPTCLKARQQGQLA